MQQSNRFPESNTSVSPIEGTQQRFSVCAPLVAIGIWLSQWKLFQPIEQQVKIPQKTVKYRPVDKLYHSLIAILVGAQALVEINKKVRPDIALQAAFGQSGCAEQSVVQETLNACTAENVRQMDLAMDTIYRQQSQGYSHDYLTSYLIMEVDLSGLPCGKKAEFASKGYFAHQRNRRGRQLGRVTVANYHEVVVDEVLEGTAQLNTALIPLVQAAEKRLGLSEEKDRWKRERTIVRVDAGGGTLQDINWLLGRGYQIHGKDFSGNRASKLSQNVQDWVVDPKIPEREVGWVTQEATEYQRPVQRIAVRCRKKNGQWGIGVIITTLSETLVLSLVPQPHRFRDPELRRMAYVYFYDQRGGGIEIEFKEDFQGLGVRKRNKKRFAAQQMLAQLNMLAHNVIVWVRRKLAQRGAPIARWGMLRMRRDIFQMSGLVTLSSSQPVPMILHIILQQSDPFANKLLPALRDWLLPTQVDIILGQI